jgi:hypothetical protein
MVTVPINNIKEQLSPSVVSGDISYKVIRI